MKRNKLVGILAGAALLAGGGAYVAREKAAPAGASAAQAATLATAQKRTLEVVAEASGVLEPVRVVEVKSQASGEVLEVEVETGMRVEQGTLLAEIEPRDVQNALSQAQADLEAARVRASTAAANKQRMEELRASQVVTQQEYESAVSSYADARAAQVRAETNLQLARERRGDVTLRAPIAGTVIERTVEPGTVIASATNNVSGGVALFKMADLSSMQVRAKVDETDIGQVQPGQRARVTVEAFPGRTFMGNVLKVEPQAVVEQNVTMFPVLVRLENPEGLLRPGMNAEVTVEIASRPDATVVPNAAVVALRDARSAATALGLSEDAVRTALQGGGGAASGAGGAGGAGQSPECTALREKVVAAGGFQSASEEDRTKLRECRQAAGGGGGGGGGGRGGMRAGGGAAGGAGGGSNGGSRPGVLFVQAAGGVEPRRVVLGLSDWENTEVVRGVEPGEQVVLVSVAQMQKAQQEATDRFRQRAGGGMIPGAGGAPGGGGGGRGR